LAEQLQDLKQDERDFGQVSLYLKQRSNRSPNTSSQQKPPFHPTSQGFCHFPLSNPSKKLMERFQMEQQFGVNRMRRLDLEHDL
jgi:hypothetical protein